MAIFQSELHVDYLLWSYLKLAIKNFRSTETKSMLTTYKAKYMTIKHISKHTFEDLLQATK